MEAAAYESLDHWRIKFLSQHMVTTETYPYFTCFLHKRSPVREKKGEISAIQENDNITTSYYPFSSLLLVNW